MTTLDNIGGSITALITPFKGGAGRESIPPNFVEWQIAEGTNGLVPVGTTGESPTLSHKEHMRVVELCVDARGRPRAGHRRRRLQFHARSHRTHAATPRRSAPMRRSRSRPITTSRRRRGFIAISPAIAEAVDLPIVLYNIPGRSIVEISVETMARLAKIANIVGVKDATGNLARASRDRAALPKSFIRLSGDDATALGFMAHGGRGCISVTSNVAPKLCADFQNACAAGDYAKALTYQDRLMALHDGLFCEASPAPTKYAASLLGLCEPEVRLPIVP